MPLSAATFVGPYEIVSNLGSGSMGEVYMARDSRLNRNVALKILTADSGHDATRKRRFAQEARAASALNHPNILTIHDFGTNDGIYYIVSELIEGESLRSLIKRGTVSIRRLLDIAIQISDGLAAAHEAGIVHRDLKPENIMLTASGRVKILDFGLAKPMDSVPDSAATSDGERTQPGLILGTVGYMSPEQARGMPLTIQSDQFALGTILHEMATGQHPFRRETPMETLLEIANLQQPPFTPGPVSFRMLVGRCLDRNPEARFQSTGEIHERLKRISDELPENRPVLECGTESREKAVPKLGRRRWPVVALAALLTFGLGLLSARLLSPRPPADFSNYRYTPLARLSNIEVLPAVSPNGNTVAYAAGVNGVFQIVTQPLRSALSTPLTHASDDCLFPFWAHGGSRVDYISNNRLWSLGSTGGSPELVFDNVSRAAVSPDGHTLALLRNDVPEGESYSLWFARDGGSPQRYSLGAFRDKHFLRSSYLAYARDGKLGLWTSEWNAASEFWVIPDRNQQPRRYLNDLSFRQPLAPMFSWMPDSEHIIYDDSHLWTAHVSTGSIHEITTGTGREQAASVFRGGSELAFASTQAGFALQQIPLDAPALTPAADEPGGTDASPAWSPVHAEYAYVTARGGQPEIRLKDTRSGWERPIVRPGDFPGRSLSLSDVTFSPDGNRVAYRRTAEKGETIWVSSLNGDAPVQIAPEPSGSFQRGPAWSPDGNWIAYFSLRAGHYALAKARADGSGSAELIRADAGTYPAWSPDGDLIATIADSGLFLVNSDGSGIRRAGTGLWLSETWSKDGGLIYGLRRGTSRRLELASLDPRSGAELTRVDLGAYPAAFSYSEALGRPPVRGASISADGKTFLTSLFDFRSALWLLSGFTK